ncbi:MAG: DUF1566 domain-containing protein [Pseudomonadota bacterium]
MFALKITSQHATAAYATLKYAGLLLSCHLLISVVYAGEATPRLNDTGIQYGGDYPQGTHTDCTAKITSFNVSQDQAESFIQQQDCSTGLSANTQQTASVFSYQKIGASGENLPPETAEWDCVTDEVSGLMWEVKRKIPDHLHSVSDRFTWYHSNPTMNGGNIGDWNRHGAHCTGYTSGKPRSYCHIEQFVSRVNKQGLCGFQDWRVPTRAELTSLIHFGASQPAIEQNYFPQTLDTFYWTANPVAGRPIEAWAIQFEFGYASPIRKTDTQPVRLVRDIQR